MELNLGAEAPAAGKPNLAAILAMKGAVAPTPPPKPEEITMENQPPSFDEISATIPQPEAQEAITAPTTEPVVAQAKPASLPRGAGVVDYRLNAELMYPATTQTTDE